MAIFALAGCGKTDVHWSAPSNGGADSDGDSDTDIGTNTDSNTDTDGNLIWAKRAGGEYGDPEGDSESGFGISALADGSALVTGTFRDTATFGPGEANETVLTSGGSWDIFVARYGADGTLAWVKRAGGISGGDKGLGISTLADGSALVTGAFFVATFGPGETNETTLTSVGELDIFVARYNADGTLAWARRAGGSDRDEGRGISTLADGSALVTGRFSEAATFGPDEANETVLISVGDWDIFVAKYNTDGTLAWARGTGGSSYDSGHGVSTLADGSALVTGGFQYTATFGLGEPNETVLTAEGEGSSDVFVARYNADGTLAWVTSAGGSDYEGGNGISTLASGSALVTGSFHGATTFGPGESNETVLISEGADIFIAKYNADGTLAWARRAGGDHSDSGAGISALADGSALVTGIFDGTATFGPGEPNETVLVSAGQYDKDLYVARHNADGTLAWVRRAGGTGTRDASHGISTLADGSSLVTGTFNGTATFGPGEPNETDLTAEGNSDVFVAKYAP